tara:strand:- start:1493 stop:1999 length:507 start_codon:yes stop_codon:yes gene_type:complete
MEDEETGVNYDATGFKNKSIDKINGQVQAMSGVTGTAPTNKTSMHKSDAKFYRGILKLTDSRPSADYGGRQGYEVRQAIKNENYGAAASIMRKMRDSKDPKVQEGFKRLNETGIKSSGVGRGGRYLDVKQTYSGEVIKNKSGSGSSRTDRVFDPATQMTTSKTYNFDN